MHEIVLHKGLRKTKVLLYDDIDQLPAERFSKVNKFWMLNDELGSSFEDIDRIHITRLALAIENKEKAKKVLDNMRVLIHNIINEVNTESMAFACLVHSIDGKEIEDLSDENLRRVIKYLSDRGLTNEVLKKKLKESGRESTRHLRISSLNSLQTFFRRLSGAK
jgi:hypothetical protein